MMETGIIQGFSKLSREAKIEKLTRFVGTNDDYKQHFFSFLHPDPTIQEKLDAFSENTISNFPVPLGLAPNFMINGKMYIVPMAIEESSVVAAASAAAKFWAANGGFHCKVKSMEKTGQVLFTSPLGRDDVKGIVDKNWSEILNTIKPITARMEKRGGGIIGYELIDFSNKLEDCYQLRINFDTRDAMGANFINSCLEAIGDKLEKVSSAGNKPGIKVTMAILSNYTPDCLVKASVQCPVNKMGILSVTYTGTELAERMKLAVDIAAIDTFRAVTHNKGIMNGVDAVLVASGNDYRAVEAAANAYAARNGQYSSLSTVKVEDGTFTMELEMPLAIGTVGGLTANHPQSKKAFEILGKPNAGELMCIIAAAGLANNFAAVKALVSTGIQSGHMRMHLSNMLDHFSAGQEEKTAARKYFEEKTITFSEVESFIKEWRKTGK